MADPAYRTLRPTHGRHRRDRARRPDRSAPRAREARGALPRRPRRDRRGGRLPRPEPVALRVARRTGGRARRGRAAASAGSVATSTAPSALRRSARRGVDRAGAVARAARDASRSRRRSPTRRGCSRPLPAWVDDPDDLRRRRGRGFAPASPDPRTLMGEVQQAITHTVERAPWASTASSPGSRRRVRRTGSLALAAQLVVSDHPPRCLRHRSRRLRHPPGPGPAPTHPCSATSMPASTPSSPTVEAAGRADRVLVMTVSEFGRRPGENGSGTDHGTAAPHFLIGSAVRGGRYGAPPSLTALDPHGNLVATTDFRSLYATALAGWLDVDPVAVLGRADGAGIRPPARARLTPSLTGVFERLAELEVELEKLESKLPEIYASGDQAAAARCRAAPRRAQAGRRDVPGVPRRGGRPRPTPARCSAASPTPRCASTWRRRSRRRRRSSSRSTRSCASCSCRRTPTTARTSSSRSAAARAARRATSGPPTCSRCTSATPTCTAGRSRC